MQKLMLAALLVWSTEVQAYTEAKSKGGAPLHWLQTNVIVHLDAGNPSGQLDEAQVAAALDGALAEWTEAPNARVHLQQGMATSPPDGDPIECWVRFVGEDWPLAQAQLASTQLWARDKSGEITAGIISVNEQDHHFSFDGRADADDLQAVLTHEVGHLLGLGHSGDVTATMYVSTAVGDTHQRMLGADDVAGLDATYGGLSPTTTTPPPGPSGCSMATHATPSLGFAPFALLLVVAFARLRRTS